MARSAAEMPTKALLWLLVPAVGLLELAGHLYFSGRPPTLDEWRDVRAPLAEMRKAGELVVVAPRWAEPNARHAFGDALMPLEQVARADETAFPRAIEVSTLGAESPALSGWRSVNERRIGKFRLRVLDNPSPSKVVYDFVRNVPSAEVEDRAGTGAQPCTWNPRGRAVAGGLHGHPAFPKERHVCRGGASHFVGITVVEDDQWLPRRCIWAEPVEGRTLVITYRDVPLGAKFRGYATLPWWLEREKKGAPVELEVSVDGRQVGRYVHNDGDGWKLFEMPTGRAGSRGNVEFRVTSRRARERQFCFVADTR